MERPNPNLGSYPRFVILMNRSSQADLESEGAPMHMDEETSGESGKRDRKFKTQAKEMIEQHLEDIMCKESNPDPDPDPTLTPVLYFGGGHPSGEDVDPRCRVSRETEPRRDMHRDSNHSPPKGICPAQAKTVSPLTRSNPVGGSC